MRTARGFTLIELLVVIAIIALLMGIMMPALSSVKRLGQLTVCKSNLKQLAIGLYTYASSHDDQLPEVYYFSDKGGLLDSHYTWPMYVLRNKYDPVSPLKYWGFGKLWEHNILEDPEIYYCPALRGERDYYSFYNPKDAARDVVDPVTLGETESHLRAYYSYSPLRRNPIRSGGTITKWPLAKRTAELGSNNILSSDLLTRYDDMVHKKGTGENAKALLNMVYGDGSVGTYSNPDILNNERASNLSNQWYFEVAEDAMK